MTKYSFILIIAIFLFGCKKEKVAQNNISDNIKITLVSGNNQSAAIGYPLNDSIVVKVTLNGSPVSNYDVQFIGSGCNQDLITDLHTKADGTVKYSWLMASDQGQQTLRVVAIETNKRIDSLTVNATATSAVGIPWRSACVPNPGGSPNRILELSTGRLIACFRTSTSIRYSDDNGISWHPIKAFGATHTVSWIATSAQDEIFAATDDAGIFYSKDAGNSWADITPASFNKQAFITDLVYTTGGKLIFANGTNNAVYTSADKGKTWTLGTGLPSNTSYGNPVELANGDLFIVSYTNILFKSTDVGKSWSVQSNYATERVMSVYVDNQGWFYEATSLLNTQGNTGLLLISKDNGVTFSNFVNFNSGMPYITNMSIQSDGYFYFDELAYSIARVYNSNFVADSYKLTNQPFAAYIVAKNGDLIFANNGGISL